MDLIQSQRMCIVNPLKNTPNNTYTHTLDQYQHLTAKLVFGAPMALINSAFITLTFVYSNPWRNVNCMWICSTCVLHIQCLPTCILYFLLFFRGIPIISYMFPLFIFPVENSFLPFITIFSQRECICNSNLHRILVKMHMTFFFLPVWYWGMFCNLFVRFCFSYHRLRSETGMKNCWTMHKFKA